MLRLGVGDTVSVFDGRGGEFLARVERVSGRDVTLQVLSRVESAAEPQVALVLAQAVLKGEKMDDVVRDAVMLGVAAVQPLVTARTEVTVAALDRGARVERWRRVALAAVKQSGRAVFPDVRRPMTFERFLEEPSASIRLMLVEPSADARPEGLSVLRAAPTPPDAAVLVGPEGGWTAGEVATAREQGVRLVTLGPRTLRADAVPLVAVSVLQFVWEPGS